MDDVAKRKEVLSVNPDNAATVCGSWEKAARMYFDALQEERAERKQYEQEVVLMRHTYLGRLSELTQQKDGAYQERNQVLALLARMATALGWKVGIGQHPESDTAWEKDWRTILFIELPTGQASWHFHDSEVHLLNGLPFYEGAWDGHTTPEKYDRVNHALRGGTAQQVVNPNRPTITELEAILSAPEGKYRVELQPNGEVRAVEVEGQAPLVKPWQGPWPRPFGYSLKDWTERDETGRGLVWFMRMRAGSMSGDGRMTMADVDLELRQHVAKQMEKVHAFVHFGAYISQTNCARQISDHPGLKVERQDWTKVTCPECKAKA